MEHSDIESIDLTEIYINSDTTSNDNTPILNHNSRENVSPISNIVNSLYLKTLLIKTLLIILFVILILSVICFMILIIKEIYE